MRKERLTMSIDPELAELARNAVAEGRAESVSALVSTALRRQLDHEVKLKNLEALIGRFEREHGEITQEEMRAASRDAAARAVIVRGKAPRKRTA